MSLVNQDVICYNANIDFIFGKIFFVCSILDAVSVLLRPPHDINVLMYLNKSLCLSPVALIKMLICGHSFFLPTNITSVFLLFNSNRLLLLSSSTTSFYKLLQVFFLQLVQCHQRMSTCMRFSLLCLDIFLGSA